MENLLNLLQSQFSDSIGLKQYFSDFTTSDWNELIQLASQHKLSLLLLDIFNKNELIELIPANQLEELREKNRLNAIKNIYILQEAQIVLEELKRHNIQTIGLKGVYLLDNVFEDVSLRSMADLDLMVKRNNISEAIDIVQTLGYQPSTYFDIHDINTDIKHVPPMIKNDHHYLEIHWTLLEENEPFLIGIDGLWERAKPVRIAGVDAFSLSLEDLLLHLCIHLAYQHSFEFGLRGLFDIAMVLKRFHDDVDWEVLISRAHAWRANRVVALTFQLLVELFKVSEPEDLITRLMEGPFPEEILKHAKENLLFQRDDTAAFTPDLVRLSAKATIWGKIRIMLDRVFLPKITMARLYGMKPTSLKVYLYYPVRFFQLWRSYRQSVRKIIRKDGKTLSQVSQKKQVIAIKEWLVNF